MPNVINWYNNAAFDAPELGSPQPCVHGAGCVFTRKNAEGVVMPACCHFVHPGEEGNGRRLFPAVMNESGLVIKKAAVRLTGKAGFYERCRLKMPWQEWCALKNIAFVPNKAGVKHAPVARFPIGKPAATAAALRAEAVMLVERIAMLVSSVKLSDDIKRLSDDAVDDILPNIETIISAVERSINVPLTEAEQRQADGEALGRLIAAGGNGE
jgi:hypothetical protein